VIFGRRILPIVELLIVAALAAMMTITYFIVSSSEGEQGLLTPPVVAALLVANLVPAMALMVLVARRFAMRRAARSPIGGKGRLHVRLVAIFSLIAAVPTLMVVVFASLIFQVGNEFWFSPRAKNMIENAAALGRQAYTQERDRVGKETVTMSADLSDYYLGTYPIESLEFMEAFGRQVLYRNLSEAVIVQVTPQGGVQTLALVNPYDRPLEKLVTPERIAPLRQGQASVVVPEGDRMGAITPVRYGENTYLYAARVHDSSMVDQLNRAEEVLKAYNTLVTRARVLQLRFNAALLLVSLLITGAAVWIALKVADRLVRPVSELVDAAGRVTAGDLSARVPGSSVRDEVGTLGKDVEAGGEMGLVGPFLAAERTGDEALAEMDDLLGAGEEAGVC